jgi:hypothetical protein
MMNNEEYDLFQSSVQNSWHHLRKTMLEQQVQRFEFGPLNKAALFQSETFHLYA